MRCLHTNSSRLPARLADGLRRRAALLPRHSVEVRPGNSGPPLRAVARIRHERGRYVPDLIAGGVVRPLSETEMLDPDFVIVRSDGNPVFHLVNVVDDLEMKITHVIRGEDHLSNTPKHIALFRAFGVEPPKYAHIPMILNPDGTKMSKRDQGASLATYMEEGYAPEAIVNYLSLLGWSPKGNREKLPVQEIIELFDLPQILRHNARFDLAKLIWLNGEYIREMSNER